MNEEDPKWYRDQKRDDDLFCIATGAGMVTVFIGVLAGILHGAAGS